MKTYDLTYIISPETSSEEIEAFTKDIESFVQSKMGVIIKQTTPFAKTLAYPIKKFASGFIGSLEFQIEPEVLEELKNKLSKDKKINRHMIVIKYPVKALKLRRSKNKDIESFVAQKEPTKNIVIEKKQDEPIIKTEEEIKKESKKVELKDIEQKLEELLGE